ncbi:MAG: YbfB/YjiJ family MFS transporter [Mesorhizobium sp.]|nr:YbfB/YjiJ family MFS transporter [Mesorhizobium sp.]
MQASSSSSLRYAVGGLVGMAAAMGIGRFVYTPILPGMMAELGLSASEAGWIASANYVGYLVGALLGTGHWAAGRERAIALGAIAASTVLLAVMAATESMAVFIAVRFLAGIASAFMMVFLTTIVFSHFAAAGRPGLQGVHFSGVGVGIATSGLMTGVLVLAGQPWQAAWLWAAGISLVALLAVAALVTEGPVVEGLARREPPLPRSPALTRIILSYGLFGFGYIITATFLVAIVREGAGGRLFESAVWVVTGLAAPPSIWLWTKVSQRIGITHTIVIGTLVEAFGVLSSVLVGGYAGPLIAAVLFGGTFVAITALGLQVARRLAHGAPRRALALMTAAFGVGQIVGPIVAGVVADVTGSFHASSIGAAVVLLVSAGLAWDAGRRVPSV